MIPSHKYITVCSCLLIALACKSDPKRSSDTQASPTSKKEGKSENLELLVGTFTNGESRGIYKLDFDPNTGTIGNTKLLIEKENPGYLCISKDRSRVFSSNATKPGSISVYDWGDNRNLLNTLSDHSSIGDGACYIELNRTENLLAVANYGSGSIALYSIDTEGNIIGGAQSSVHSGKGPHPNQKSAHAHCVKFDAPSNFLYAVDLGIDQIVAYPITDNKNLGKPHTALKMNPGDGPRHLIFHPEKNMAFIINELSSTVVSALVDPRTGRFERIDGKSTLPADFDGDNACADIHLGHNGKFLYASNRGDNSIAIFSVSEDGHLNLLTTEPVRGDWPRNFTLSPDGAFLLVANQKSDNITVFKIDPSTGLLSYTGNEIRLAQPVCLKF